MASLVALGTSVALLLDYVSPEPSFCGIDSGCGAVRASGFGYLPFFGLGILPVPALGVLAFGLLYSATLLRSFELRAKLAAPLALAIGSASLPLIALQAYIGQFCSLCLVVDCAGILCGVSAFALRSGGFERAFHEEEPTGTLLDPQALMSEGQRVKGVWRDDSQIYDAPNPLVRPAPKDPLRLKLSGWVSFGFLAVLAPLFFPSFVQTSEVPSAIRALYDPKQVTVVEFFDFQCPHCRDLSPRLKAIVAEEGSAEIRYGYTPLPGNPNSHDAARIAICAAEQGKEGEVTSAFFIAPDLAPEKALGLASQLVPDAKALEACLASKRPDARIEKDTAIIKEAGFVGLPTTYIGGVRVLGAEADVVYRDALVQAKSGGDRSGMTPWTYWFAVLALVGVVGLLTRVPPVNRQSLPG